MKFIKRLFIFSLVCIFLGVTTIFGFYLYVKPELPDVATLKDVKLQTPMQVFSRDGQLISQFGEKRRIPVKYEDIPQELIDALIATEDSRFYDHPGIDPIGIVRAAFVVAMSGSAKQGASTLTQQLARNFFLTNEKKIMRKIKEIFIAIHIERLLTKQEILELYVNKVFLGYRSYGFGAAARVYFGRELDQLTLSELAMLAGMPKAPSTMNPLYSLERATNRRNVVLLRMLDEKYITKEEFEAAKASPIVARYHGAEIELSAPYVAELARAWMVERYGEEVYTSGKRVYTTVTSKLQTTATEAAINNLLAYDQRHGFRGAIDTWWQPNEPVPSRETINQKLDDLPIYGPLIPAVVTDTFDRSIEIMVKRHGNQTIDWDGLKWARRFVTDTRQGPEPNKAADIVNVGEVIWVQKFEVNNQETGELETLWNLSQLPDANTAFVALNPENGSLEALVGGFNFIHNKFNRATQSIRQVGSSIKPFIYSAAVDSGMTLATLVNDAPINQWDQSQGTAWRPKNSPPKYIGPTRMRIGLATSKNVMAVRVLREVGLDPTREYLTRFGFKLDELPRSETIALGAGSLTPVQMAQGYSAFANGGYYVEPYFIERVESPFGEIEHQAAPLTICRQECQAQALSEATDLQDTSIVEEDVDSQYAPRIISENTAFLMREMLYSNVWGGGNWAQNTGWNGTGWRAQSLKRRDVGGKTGTTNDSKDAWYSGYGPGIVATVWVGFDDHNRELGKSSYNNNLGRNQVSGGEAGAKTAQPAWVDFMAVALEDTPQQRKQIPDDIVRVRIDRDSGLLTNQSGPSSMFEYFVSGTEPNKYVEDKVNGDLYSEPTSDELF